jgi:hypothetical protein
MLSMIQTTNLAVRFALELALLAAAGYCAWRTVPHRGLRAVAVVGLPLAVAVVWATVVHGPDVPSAIRLATQVGLFAAAVVALAALNRSRVAATLAAAFVLNAALMALWAQ